MQTLLSVVFPQFDRGMYSRAGARSGFRIPLSNPEAHGWERTREATPEEQRSHYQRLVSSVPARVSRDRALSLTPFRSGLSDRKVAYHEAAHAVALHACGHRVSRVTIQPTATHSGFCGHGEIHDPSDRAIVSLAGIAAENKLRTGEASTERQAFDWNTCEHQDGAQDDFRFATDALGTPSFHNRTQWFYAHYAVLAICDRYWSQIEAIADLLMERGTIFGTDVERIMPVVRN